MLEKRITDILKDPRLNLSGLCLEIKEPGLSRSSILNKMNPSHSHQFKDADLQIIADHLRKLANDICQYVEK